MHLWGEKRAYYSNCNTWQLICCVGQTKTQNEFNFHLVTSLIELKDSNIFLYRQKESTLLYLLNHVLQNYFLETDVNSI